MNALCEGWAVREGPEDGGRRRRDGTPLLQGVAAPHRDTRFGRSLNLRQVSASVCNACEAELATANMEPSGRRTRQCRRHHRQWAPARSGDCYAPAQHVKARSRVGAGIS